MPDTELPGFAELFVLVRDENNAPCGIQPVEERLEAAAKASDPEAVLSVLKTSKDLEELLLASLLAPRVTRDKPAFADKAAKLLVRMVSDHRTFETPVGGVKQVFDLAACAFGAYFELIRRRPPDMVAILAVLDASLLNPRRADLTSATVIEFNRLFQGEARYRQAAEEVAEILADAAADSQLGPSTRIRAYEAIVCGGRFGPTGGRPHPTAKTAFEKERARAAEALVRVLEETQPKPEIRDYVLCNLHMIRPESIAVLQGKGIIPAGPLPAPEALVNFAWRAADPVKVVVAALSLKPPQVQDALASGDDADPGVLSAILLAPWFARRCDWRTLAGALLKRVDGDRELVLRQAGHDVPFHLGREAASSLLSLLKAARETDELEALDWTFKALEACLARGMTPSGVPIAPVMDYLMELGKREAETGGRLRKTMLECIGAASRPASLRFTAYCNYRALDPAAEAAAQAALANPREDPDFLALLRTVLAPK